VAGASTHLNVSIWLKKIVLSTGFISQKLRLDNNINDNSVFSFRVGALTVIAHDFS
jgi:hypothetical protein